MLTFWQDVRYGLRMLGKNPGFTAVAVLTMALGIGANTAIFSLMDQILLRRLPVKNPDQLVILRSPGPGEGHIWSDGDDAQSFSYPAYKGLRDGAAVSGMLARFAFEASIASGGQTERGLGELVSGNYFEVLGVRPAFGRLFTADDDRRQGGHPLVILSHGYWMQHFGGDPGILNHTLLVNNTPLTVIGVAQEGFDGIQVGQTPNIFVPMMMKPQMTPNSNGLDDWNDGWLAILARRRADLSWTQTEAALTAAYRPLLEQQLATIKGWDQKERALFLDKKILLLPGASGRRTVQTDSGPALLTLFALVALVLLIACTNVANLLLAQGASRQREFAIRTAMGASRGRMMRQLLIESLLCAAAGGAMGLAIGLWLMNILTPEVTASGVSGLSAKLNGTVLAFAGGTTLLAGVLFGLIPAWRVTRSSVTQTLKDQGSTGSVALSHVRFRKFLVAGQVAFTLLLLAGACLFTRTLWNLRSQSLGLDTTNVITFSISPALNGYDTARSIALIDQMRERFAALPGVKAVGSSEISTLTGTDMGANITVEGGQKLHDDQVHVLFDPVSPAYFSAVGVPLVSGREFNAGDTSTRSKVAIVNETMARRFFSKRDPMGARFAFGSGDAVKPDIQIVGVVKDNKQDHVRSEMAPYIFLPYAQREKLSGMTFYVRTQRDPLLIADELRDSVRGLDPNLPVYHLKTLQRVVDEDLLAERLIAGLSASFGVLAALLAAMGIYGVLAYLVIQRTREIGIRIALGAATGQVRKLIFKEVGFMVVAGALVGLPVAYALARLSESLLYGVRANNIGIYLAALSVVAVIAAAACYIPVRRASQVDPMVALRYE
ncbi:MAG: putative transport system permease protein [Acidobacteriaceae bacterium]|nr:putative transport system permease protein [Acidobacteriaceae bacterium]